MRNVFLLFLLLFFAACTTTSPSQNRHIAGRSSSKSNYSTSQPRYSNHGTYVVQSGDSIWMIAKEYSISQYKLLQLNNLSSARDLRAGQKLRVPKKKYSRLNSRFSWPVKGQIVKFFGEKSHTITNSGLEIKTAAATVIASDRGKVVFCDYINGWGKTLILKHKDNFYTIYANLENISVKNGIYVKKRDIVGKVACGKNTANRILHFEIRKQHLPQDPLSYLE